MLDKHARQLRTHVDQLAKKEYWKQFERSPEFVVAFIPGDQLLAAACEADPRCRTTPLNGGSCWPRPNTLVATLRTIALSGSRRRWPRTRARSSSSGRSSTSGCGP